ncbi:AGE family epimerase/isomerase [Gaoshiqia sp. Z1-71]|jgi:mannobiose 2-epimerase|uniref:AGE family epimerase/isomerase n=1 Tax=Gaoshiqia hydrogeniformans TaxID=3290090 RepID=UPI003BF8D521
MKKVLIIFIGFTVQMFSLASAQVATNKKVSGLVSESVQDLKHNTLPFWEKNTPDPSGGFYGTVLNDGTAVPDAPKGGVLNARILWTFSKAYQLFGNENYKELADRAQSYFLMNFIDQEYGGTYWTINADGTPLNAEKQTYAIAYAIYGLAEHYRAIGNKESLKQAIELYRTLEKRAFDPLNGGYIESFSRNWETPERFGYDGSGIAAKTMNTHLHVLEAYTLLYKVWPDKELKKQLTGLINLFYEKIIDQKTGHQKLFLTMEWENLEHIDSYGHDMELSWLLFESAEAIKDKTLIRRTEKMALKLVDIQMKEGWNPDGSLLYERNNGQIHGGLEWWPQAESVVAFYNAWQISGDEKYLDAAIKTWSWIKNNLVDTKYGGWYGGVGPDGKPNLVRPKVSLWKCPYHNSRMAFELFQRTQ